MLTYNLSEKSGPLYESLYEFIKEDIKSRKLVAHEKLPSKRTLSENLGVSTITVENAYGMLLEEGYIYALEKRGYFVSEVPELLVEREEKKMSYFSMPEEKKVAFNFSSNHTEPSGFPFSVWAKIMREVISVRENDLLKRSPAGGVFELRQAISAHLASFRGMQVSPDQIIVGAGTEYLYGLLVKLLGEEKIYCIENPGYQKIRQVYESNGARCVLASMDQEGVLVSDIKKEKAEVVHLSPTHHFPTGITMSLKRRIELLSWANENENRVIIEDDYDSEFRLNGKPLPSLFSIDQHEKVIYMNTFSKSLASTIRISYMVLPVHLTKLFYEKLGFYSCTVSTFEQYTLSEFIKRGYFEKHINRMRLQYVRKRKAVLEVISKVFSEHECQVIENDSGLHFLLSFETKRTDKEVKDLLLRRSIRLDAVTDYRMDEQNASMHQFILNYSNLDMDLFESHLLILKEVLCKEELQ